MFEMISKRRSVREYSLVSTPKMEKDINGLFEKIRPLSKQSSVAFELVKANPADRRSRAPFHVILRMDQNDNDYDNAGFMGEQLVLMLTRKGYGTCWLGVNGPKMPKKPGMKSVIQISVGHAKGELHRKSVDEFKRRSASKISQGNCPNVIIEAVRLAPSAVNLQPWYISGDGEVVHVYRRKCLGPFYLQRTTCLDIGIALCHIYAAAQHLEREIAFEKAEHPELKGKKYVISASLNKKFDN